MEPLLSTTVKCCTCERVEVVLRLAHDTELSFPKRFHVPMLKLNIFFVMMRIQLMTDLMCLYIHCARMCQLQFSSQVHHVFRLLRQAKQDGRGVPWVLLENVHVLHLSFCHNQMVDLLKLGTKIWVSLSASYEDMHCKRLLLLVLVQQQGWYLLQPCETLRRDWNDVPLKRIANAQDEAAASADFNNKAHEWHDSRIVQPCSFVDFMRDCT